MKGNLFRNSGAATQQVSKRLQSELMTLMMSGDQVGWVDGNIQKFPFKNFLLLGYIGIS